MEFELHHEKDAGPIVRWFATKLLGIMHTIEKPLYDYADMYTAVWDEYEDDILATPQNQMGLFEGDFEMLPQFEWIGDDLL